MIFRLLHVLIMSDGIELRGWIFHDGDIDSGIAVCYAHWLDNDLYLMSCFNLLPCYGHGIFLTDASSPLLLHYSLTY